jgi:hypothetical protein
MCDAAADGKLAPIKKIGLHLCALHAYSGDIRRQIVAHHFCSHVNEEMHQCVIYDSDKPHAKLIGVEYLVSERIFKSLDAEEKRYWHSHHFEVSSGMLTAPDLDDAAEIRVVSQIAKMYGKIVHTWAIDKYDLPIGPPSLMTSITAAEYFDPHVVAEHERRVDITLGEQRKKRDGVIIYHDKLEGADQWEKDGTATIFLPSKVKDPAVNKH